jgi:hypothetical protein
MMSLTCIPSGATLAAAKTNLDALIPSPGTAITIIDGDSTLVDATFSGAYVIQSAKLNRTNKSMASVTVEVAQWDSADLSVTQT